MLLYDKISLILVCLICILKLKMVYTIQWSNNNPDVDEIIREKADCFNELGEKCSQRHNDAFGVLLNSKLKNYKSSLKRSPLKNFHKSCQCEMSYSFVDLGNDYYPRYIQSGECKKFSCGPYHRCIAKTYPLQVLKRRELNEETQEKIWESYIPESLAENWVLVQMPVVIACECIH